MSADPATKGSWGLEEDTSVYPEQERIWSPAVDQVCPTLGSRFTVTSNDWNDPYSTGVSRWHTSVRVSGATPFFLGRLYYAVL